MPEFLKNQLQVATSSGNVTDESLVIPTNEWTHIAVTYDADDKKQLIIYINGKEYAGDYFGLRSRELGPDHDR